VSTTDNPTDPRIKRGPDSGPTKQSDVYLVLSEEERAKGFERPYRESYSHVGMRPKYDLRDLTDEEKQRYAAFGYTKFEAYPEVRGDRSSVVGRFWTEQQLKPGCGVVTRMDRAIAETYARDPKFYGGTYCTGCRMHLPVAEFTWDSDGTEVGS